MKAPSQPIKNFVRFFTLYAFGLVAHVAAGGSFVSFTQLFALTTLVGLVLFCAQKVELEGPQPPLRNQVVKTMPSLVWIEFDGNLVTLGDKAIDPIDNERVPAQKGKA